MNYHKALLNLGDRRNRTPLHIACIHGSIRSLRTLISLKCDVNRKDHDGYTPLQWSVEAPLPCANALLDAGADPNFTDKSGKSALYWAILREHALLAKEFMRRNLWFDSKSLNDYICDMSLGHEKHPVMLDLRPMEDCRAYLLQHLRPPGSDCTEGELASEDSMSGTSSSPMPDIKEDCEAIGMLMTRKRMLADISHRVTTMPFCEVNSRKIVRQCSFYPMRYTRYSLFVISHTPSKSLHRRINENTKPSNSSIYLCTQKLGPNVRRKVYWL